MAASRVTASIVAAVAIPWTTILSGRPIVRELPAPATVVSPGTPLTANVSLARTMSMELPASSEMPNVPPADTTFS